MFSNERYKHTYLLCVAGRRNIVKCCYIIEQSNHKYVGRCTRVRRLITSPKRDDRSSNCNGGDGRIICYGVQPIGSLPTYLRSHYAGGKKIFQDNFSHRRALTYSSFMQMIPALRHWP